MTPLLASLAAQDCEGVEVVLNDDASSSDDLEGTAAAFRGQGLDVRVIHDNPTMPAGRRRGAALARGRLVLHLDTDMTAPPGLLSECRDMIDRQGYDALVIPEVSVGEGFWARCKVLEKSCHDGDPRVEGVRCMPRELYERVGGHDENFVWGEDKDLDLRVRAAGARIGVTGHALEHREGRTRLGTTMRKKAFYAATAHRYAMKQPRQFAIQASPLRLVRLGLRGWRISRDPRLVGGLLLLKSCEYLAVGLSLLGLRPRARS
ncbi:MULTISPECIES: glycosyltransferase [Streptomyces]|uniref:Glycosyltransferase n=1 Tax=Streptomyces solicathayae TaxID=3081768 RepID=A0ABZ0LZ24_9ACTN|nr:glycosyltransferase [Streptomyces sp. HUAS YS2]WOX24687.1 glycosyltransferase [Streptomyces sp. HUAS YS2]